MRYLTIEKQEFKKLHKEGERTMNSDKERFGQLVEDLMPGEELVVWKKNGYGITDRIMMRVKKEQMEEYL